MFSRNAVASARSAASPGTGLVDAHIRQLGLLRSGSARLHERYPSLASDVLAPDLQRQAYLRWSRRAGRMTR
jgi:hypothetical protein